MVDFLNFLRDPAKKNGPASERATYSENHQRVSTNKNINLNFSFHAGSRGANLHITELDLDQLHSAPTPVSCRPSKWVEDRRVDAERNMVIVEYALAARRKNIVLCKDV